MWVGVRQGAAEWRSGAKVGKVGSKWFEVVRSGWKWFEVVRSGSEWFRVVQSGLKQVKVG